MSGPRWSRCARPFALYFFPRFFLSAGQLRCLTGAVVDTTVDPAGGPLGPGGSVASAADRSGGDADEYLVGRKTDLERLGGFLAGAANVGGSLVLLGEPGVGKSALLAAVARAAEGAAVEGAERWPFDLAWIRLYHGERLRRAKPAAQAREELAAAATTFSRLGAQPWAERALQELRACGGHATAPAPPAAVLTPQQWEIARLAAAGLSNKQIGERLFVSPRTVSTRLYQLFPKLGVSSRAALRDALERLPEQ